MYKIVKIRNGKIVGIWMDEFEAQKKDDLAFKHLLWNMTALHEAEQQRAAGERPVFGRPINADELP